MEAHIFDLPLRKPPLPPMPVGQPNAAEPLRGLPVVTPKKLTVYANTGAMKAARAAVVIRELGLMNTQQKTSADDVVTNGDFLSQKILQETLPARAERRFQDELENSRPGEAIGFLGEEKIPNGRTVPEEANYRWVVDPVDGTKPYKNGDPYWSVSIALQRKTGLAERVNGEAGEWESTNAVIYCTSPNDRMDEKVKKSLQNKIETQGAQSLTEEDFDQAIKATTLEGKLYWAEKGRGAHLMDFAGKGYAQTEVLKKPEQIAPVAEFEEVPESKTTEANAYAAQAKKILVEKNISSDWRRSICYGAMEVLEGKKAAVVQGTSGPYDWDVAALSLIAKEAGAQVSIGKGITDEKGHKRYHTLVTFDPQLFDALKAAIPSQAVGFGARTAGS